MEEKDWLLLKTLKETRNITKAANMLHTSQPALSKRLRQLEDNFGAAIALRNKNGIELTPAGEYLVKSAGEILEIFQRIRETVNNMGSEVKGTLRIGASNFSTQYFLPSILAGFKEKMPLVEFNVISGWSSDILRMVCNGELHAGFIRNEHAITGERYLLFREKMMICARHPLDLSRLPDEPLIAYRSDPLLRTELDAWWAENYSRPPSVAMMVDRMHTSGEMAAMGLGYAFLSEVVAQHFIGMRHYDLLHADGTPYLRDTWLIPNQDARQLRLVQTFIDFVANFTFEDKLASLYYKQPVRT